MLRSNESESATAAAAQTNTSSSRTSRKPGKASLREAHKYLFDRLHWQLWLAEEQVRRLVVEGDQTFTDFLEGRRVSTKEDRAVTAVAQALVEAATTITPRKMEIMGRGAEELNTLRGRDVMLARMRTQLRGRMLRAIKTDGFEGLQKFAAGRFVDARWTYLANDLDDELLGLLVDHEEKADGRCDAQTLEPSNTIGLASPTSEDVRKAVRMVFSPSGVHFDVAIRSRSPFRLYAKGGQRFRLYRSGARIATCADVARTAVVRTVERLVPQFDESALRNRFPGVPTSGLTAPGMLKFVRKQVRASIELAIAQGGYESLLNLDDWRRPYTISLDDDDGVLDEPNELDAMVEGVQADIEVAVEVYDMFGWERPWAAESSPS